MSNRLVVWLVAPWIIDPTGEDNAETLVRVSVATAMSTCRSSQPVAQESTDPRAHVTLVDMG